MAAEGGTQPQAEAGPIPILTDEHKEAVKDKTEIEILAGIALAAAIDSRLAPSIPALVNGTKSYFEDDPATFDVDQWRDHVERQMEITVQNQFLAGMVVGMVVMAIIL